MDREQFSELKDVLQRIHKKNPVLATLLFGSQATGTTHNNSDIDVCVVLYPQMDIWDTRNHKNGNSKDILGEIWSIVGDRYDIWLFQELPFHLKSNIIDNHKIIYCKDIPFMYEYFYRYRTKMGEYKRRLKIAYGRA